MRSLYSILALAFLTLVFFSCSKKNDQQATQAPPAVSVTVEEVRVTDAAYHDEYPGTVVALDVVELRPQVSGFITGVHFKDGARVRKGQLLYTVDSQLYTANYDQAVAALKVQEANLSRAQKDADRYHVLEKNDAVAKQLVDNADAALEVAQKQVEAAKAAIKGVQTNVRYTKVVAPFDGTIGISLVKKGAAVTAGQTVLNTVSTDGQLAVDFNVDQKEIFRFTQFLQNGKNLNDSTFTLAFGADVYPYSGKLSFLDRAVDPQTGTIKTRLVFPNPKNLLRSGMSGTVRVLNSSSKAIVVPYKAVTEQLGEYFVYVPGDSSKVSQRHVKLGKVLGTRVIVTEGLKENEKLVVEGVQNLREGVVIKTDKQ